MSDDTKPVDRPHVEYGPLYLYRDATVAWGWPDVLTTTYGKHLHLDAEEADEIAEMLEDARSAASLAEYLKALLADGTAPTEPAPTS